MVSTDNKTSGSKVTPGKKVTSGKKVASGKKPASGSIVTSGNNATSGGLVASDGGAPSGFDSARLSHAYIASGAAAESIALAAVCSGQGVKPCMTCSGCRKVVRRIHPDIMYIDKPADKREIIVSQIRWLKKDVIVIPVEAEKKVYIINDADLMNTTAQNAFLQMLEEPPSHTVFILRTENPAQLLPTVRSRCVQLNSGACSASEDSVTADLVKGFFSSLEAGNVDFTEFMFRLEKQDKVAFESFITAAREQIPAYILASYSGKYKVPCGVLAHAEQVLVKSADMLNLSINTGHITGLILASLLTIDS